METQRQMNAKVNGEREKRKDLGVNIDPWGQILHYLRQPTGYRHKAQVAFFGIGPVLAPVSYSI